MSVEKLKKHVDRYGTDQVMQAAIELAMPRQELLDLQAYVNKKNRSKLTPEEELDRVIEEIRNK